MCGGESFILMLLICFVRRRERMG